MTEEEIQAEVDRILVDRVRLRCTGKKCDLRSGFWVAKSFLEYYLKDKLCSLCGSKAAHELKVVE